MRDYILLLTLLLGTYQLSYSQSFTSYLTGSEENIEVAHNSGYVLSGGGSDNEQAMQWMLERAMGGDILILRASGADGYNNYFYSELGVNVNSVETILFHNRSGSYDTQVLESIKNAEVIFIAGGDQSVYYDYWKESPVAEALQYAIDVKKICIGGTSAGMMILGGIIYAPTSGSATSQASLNNPFDSNIESLQNSPVLDIPFLQNTIMDTHFDNRDRAGRLVTFMARVQSDFDIQAYAIACNEVTSICIDENGIASIYGEYPEYEDYAYFIKLSCDEYAFPEQLIEGEPLTWNYEQKSLSATRIAGTTNGSNKININSKEILVDTDITEQLWSVESGILKIVNGTTSCATNDTENVRTNQLILYPNPTTELLKVTTPLDGSYQIIDIQGTLISTGTQEAKEINVKTLAKGIYWLKTKNALTKFVKI